LILSPANFAPSPVLSPVVVPKNIFCIAIFYSFGFSSNVRSI
jgi:hypothetical protein